MNIELLKKGVYQHYKGQHYKVIYIAHHTEKKDNDGQPKQMVVYRSLYGKDRRIWVRPLDMFIEYVVINQGSIEEKEVPRFTYISRN